MIDDKERVRLASDIVQVASRYVSLKPVGARFKACCPFHEEKTPSFSIDPERQTWHCFGSCQTGGDVFTFIMKAENLTFPESLQRLADLAGIPLQQQAESPLQAAQRTSQKQRLRDLMTEAQRYFRLSFNNAPSAQTYASQRGISATTIDSFGIGWAPDSFDSLVRHLQSLKINLEDAVEAGLIFKRNNGPGYTDRFRNRLMFPIHDPQERVIAFGGRITEQAEGTAKYLNSPETPLFSKSQTIYGLPMARAHIQATSTVLVTEGYMDTVICNQYGIQNVVATLGTSLTQEHIRILQRYAETVVLSFDADNPGVQAALKASTLFESVNPDLQIRILRLPTGFDPDSFLTQNGTTAFRDLVDSAVKLPEFRLDVLKLNFKIETPTGKAAYLKAAIRLVTESQSLIDQDYLIRRLAPFHPSYESNSIGAEETIRTEIKRLNPARRDDSPLSLGKKADFRSQRKGKRGPAHWEVAQYRLSDDTIPGLYSGESGLQRAEEILLLGLIDDQWSTIACDVIASIGGLACFSSHVNKDLHDVLTLHQSENSDATGTALLTYLLDSPAAPNVSRIINRPHSELNEKTLRDCGDALFRQQARTAQREILSNLTTQNPSADMTERLRIWIDLVTATKQSNT